MAIKHIEEYRDSEIAKMSNYLDADIPRAVAALGRITKALDKYAQSSAPDQAALPSSEPDSASSEAAK